ncbi:hypothetical protein H4582DRAFT_1221657 [Lactarius indigo]|nr:hypothetical protein H4582DRAFT_1221657 [Lactarius indigo]
MNNSSDGPAQSERKDFDDGANALWSLYSKEAQAHDEALFQGLLADMSGVPTFAGLFAAVITSFLIDGLKNLQPDPAQQSVYYQQQSVAMLAQISQQIASIAPQVSVPSTPPPPYPIFHPSKANVAMNSFWLVGLIHSLVAAFCATFVQQGVRSHLQIFQRYDQPLKRARFRQFFFDATWSAQSVASTATATIRSSLVLFFLGLGISMFDVNTTIGIVTVVFIIIFLLSSYGTPGTQDVYLTYFFGLSTYVEASRERKVMEGDDERKDRDVRAIQWLIDRTMANAEMEPFVSAIPGAFNTEWGQDVWREVSYRTHDTSESPPAGRQVSLTSHSTPPLKGAAISRCVRYLFETCNHHSYFGSEEARHTRMRVCVEAVAALVCHLDYRLDWFGEVGKVVSEIGQIERVNLPTTTSDTSFIIRWSCLSLMVIQRILGQNRLQVLAGYAANELVRFQSEHGPPNETEREGAPSIDESLQTAWECVEDLRQAFEPWPQEGAKEQAEETLRNREQQISELERIQVEADGMKTVDQEISLYQDAMDNATYGLIRQLPGVSFVGPQQSEPSLISGVFNAPVTGSALLTSQLIFPGQQLKALARLGRKLREVLDGQVSEGYEEVLKSLKSVDKVPVALRRPNGLMRRQLWRLLDLRDGGGLGFTVELFFLSLRRLLSISSLDEQNSVFYTGTFKVITSHWTEGKESLGTQYILLNIICDLIIPGRGIFSDFSYPESITTMLLDVTGNVLRGYTGPDEHIRDAVREIESADPDEYVRDGVREIEDAKTSQMDRRELQRRALAAIARSRGSLEHLEPDDVGSVG